MRSTRGQIIYDGYYQDYPLLDELKALRFNSEMKEVEGLKDGDTIFHVGEQ